ncbi:Sec-independent protein translocase protein TatB [Corynebacterium capitovis DSM 44611]|nr:Sec-independent protein translocase protein TatB [Corynebacterium capitovis DSM 44611]
MFSSIGWGEIFFILIIGLIVIGPERLPSVVKDVRAALYAARKAIDNAKKELDGGLGEEFDELRKPLSAVTEYASLGPRKAAAKLLFDGDEAALDDIDPRSALGDRPAPAMPPRQGPRPAPKKTSEGGTGSSFSWADIT